jgi:hypothetical protein
MQHHHRETRPALAAERASGSDLAGRLEHPEDNESHDRRKTLLLATMRVAWLNLETWQAELDSIGIALKGGTISLEDACEWLDDIGLLAWLPEREEARQ